MRRCIAPATGALIAAVLMIALVPLERVPAPLVRLLADGEGSTALMLHGGYRVSLSRSGGERVAEHLEAVGFEVRELGGSLVVADVVATDVALARVGSSSRGIPVRLLESGLYWPFEIAVIERHPAFAWKILGRPVTPRDITEIRRSGGRLAVELERPALAARLEALDRRPDTELAIFVRDVHQPLFVDRDLEALTVLASGEVRGYTLDFDRRAPREASADIDHLPERVQPVLDIARVEPLEPAASAAEVAWARAILAALVAAVVFIAVAIAAGRVRVQNLIRRDSVAGGRARVAGAAALTLAVMAFGLARGQPGSFMAPIEAGLLARPGVTTAVDLGYTALMAGFVAALIASLARPKWRSDLVCDRAGGRRLVRRGCVLAAVAAALVLVAPLFNERLNVVFTGTPAEAIAFAELALGVIVALLIAGSRALGGQYLTAAVAVLAAVVGGFTGHLGRDLDGGALGGGAIAIAAIAIAAIGATTAALLSRETGDHAAPLRAPVGGIMPVALGVGFALLIVVQFLLGQPSLWRDLGIRLAIALPLVAAAGAFELQIRRGLGGARVARLAGASRRGEPGAIAVSVGFFAALIAVETLAAHLGLPAFAVLTALATAALMDLGGELRARWRRPSLRPIWHVHQPQLAGLVERALTSRGLAVHMRGRYLRNCLGIFAAFIPITAMVDRDRADEARHVIRSVLG